MNVTFPKSEKLCGDIAIDTLYKTGKKCYNYNVDKPREG